MAMIIIDSQVHIWAPETPEKPYFTENASKPHRPIPLGHKELLREMDANGVQRTVCVPPTWEGFATRSRSKRRACIPTVSRSWDE